jgi:hypothetical protein
MNKKSKTTLTKTYLLTLFLIICLSNNKIFSQSIKQDSLKGIAERQLKEVVIYGNKKPTLETKSDRFVFNVENSSLVDGNNVLNVLQQTPLLNVDETSGINIMGFQKAVVYINNRKSVLTGKDLLDYLKNMPADNIVKIEIITTPSAKYDATDGGVINLVLKRLETDGWKGNISLTNEQKRMNSTNTSGYLNYHKNKFSQSTNLYIGKDNTLTYDYNVNRIYIDNTTQIINSKKGVKDFHLGGTTSLDYELNEKNIIGGVFELHSTTLENYLFNNNYTILNDNTQNNKYLSNNNNDGGNKMIAGNLFYKFNDKKTEKSLDLNFDWIYLNTDNNSVFNTYLSENQNQWTYANLINTDENKKNYAFKIDYAQPIAKTGYSVEIGGKINFLTLKNPYIFNNWNGNEFVLNTTNSNKFNYDETINALYFNINKQYFKLLNLKFGLRVENTFIKTLQETNQISNNRDYTNWLPYINFNYKINTKNNLTISYKKSLLRPYSNEMNPFTNYNNINNLSMGNPSLKVEDIDNYKLTYIYKKAYSFISYYQKTSNFINTTINQEGSVFITKPINLNGSMHEYYMGVNISQALFKNKITLNVSTGVSIFDNSEIEKQNNIKLNGGDFYRLKLSFDYKDILKTGINLNAYLYAISASNYANFTINKPSAKTTFTIDKYFKRLDVKMKMKISDPFNIYYWERTYYSPTGAFNVNNESDYRGISLSIVKKFGNNKSKDTEKTESEKGRTETGQSTR